MRVDKRAFVAKAKPELLYPEARAQSRRDHQGAATLKESQGNTPTLVLP
jgi:hypothetical protein